jgi:RNA polymerase sigma-70 factor (ECF subfamily)
MLEDKMLLWKFRRGSTDALRRIYDKYKNDLLGLAIALSHDRTAAEDALQDVFCSLAQRGDKLRLKTSLKSYLSTCIANRIRDIKRKKSIQTVELDQAGQISTEDDQPDTLVMSAELSAQVEHAMAQLPYDQREVIFLHLHSGMKFREIAESQNVLLNTVLSRYRYGLEQLRSQLNGKVESWKTQTISKD